VLLDVRGRLVINKAPVDDPLAVKIIVIVKKTTSPILVYVPPLVAVVRPVFAPPKVILGENTPSAYASNVFASADAVPPLVNFKLEVNGPEASSTPIKPSMVLIIRYPMFV
jgi:hypothetical protein